MKFETFAYTPVRIGPKTTGHSNMTIIIISYYDNKCVHFLLNSKVFMTLDTQN